MVVTAKGTLLAFCEGSLLQLRDPDVLLFSGPARPTSTPAP